MTEKPSNTSSSRSRTKSNIDESESYGTSDAVTIPTNLSSSTKIGDENVDMAGEDGNDDGEEESPPDESGDEEENSPPMDRDPFELKNTYLRLFRQKIEKYDLRSDTVRALNQMDKTAVIQREVAEEVGRTPQTLSTQDTIPEISNFGGVAAIPRPDATGWIWWRRPSVLQFNEDLLDHAMEPAAPQPNFDDQDTFVIGNAALEFQQSLNQDDNVPEPNKENSRAESTEKAVTDDPQAIGGFDARKLPFIETIFTYANASRPTFEFDRYGTAPIEVTEVPEIHHDRYEAYQIDADIDFDWIAPKDWITPIDDFGKVLQQAIELTIVEIFSLVKYAWDPDSFDLIEEIKEMLSRVVRGAQYDSLIDIYLMEGVDPENLETVDLGGVVVPTKPPEVHTKANPGYLRINPNVNIDATSISIDAWATYKK